ncbi:MAG: leucyl aminopeptidase [Alphaproteobacteria bacterium CG_4_10_14_0_8_um_filter_53_9]|nr:MAG: leucyl aminopeptidase [Alphaproteobacteria bacterium CG_4_10_14_0_8_um_filter_53_9]
MFAFAAARLTDKSAKKVAIVFAGSKAKLTEPAELVNVALDNPLIPALKNTRFQGSMGEVEVVTSPHAQLETLVVVGVGKVSDLEGKDWWNLGLKIGAKLDALGLKEASLCLGDLSGKVDIATAATQLTQGIAMALYRFDGFKSEQKDHQKSMFQKLTVLTNTATARKLEDMWPATKALLEGAFSTRDAANLPPNVANPQYMADQAKKLEKFGIKTEIIDEKQMEKLGLNLILAVGGNASQADKPRLILMHYNGGKKSDAPMALVGKGVMYDTGGYNIKTGGHMGGMKFDMCGAAAVLGAMEAIAKRKPKINVIGVMSCAMNMIGENPFLPDSIYKSYKGLYVEIGNTDAEGRLVLADAIAYTIDKHNPSQLIDLATLTGACMVCLGGAYAGLFSNNDRMAKKLTESGEGVGERLWRMPIDDCFKAKTKVADVNNDGSPYGGASTAATFIGNFVDKTPWAHLDIAGTANADKVPGLPAELSGATGFGTRLLVDYVESEVGHPQIAPKQGTPGRPAAKQKTAKKS